MFILWPRFIFDTNPYFENQEITKEFNWTGSDPRTTTSEVKWKQGKKKVCNNSPHQNLLGIWAWPHWKWAIECEWNRKELFWLALLWFRYVCRYVFRLKSDYAIPDPVSDEFAEVSFLQNYWLNCILSYFLSHIFRFYGKWAGDNKQDRHLSC